MTLINNSAFLVFKVLFEIHYKKKVEKHLKPSGKIKLYWKAMRYADYI